MAQEPSQIREQIAGTPNEIAGTVQGLAGKADVKRRVRESVRGSAAGLQDRATQLSGRVREAVPDQAKDGFGRVSGQIREQPWIIAVGATVLLLLALAAWRRRH